MIIPMQILDKLRCSSCADPLSIGPVQILPNGANVCGRCTQLGSIGTPNEPYNALAELCLFPCKFETQGCVEKCAFVNMRQHELDCVYRTYLCPVVQPGACEWVGSRIHLKEHVIYCHADRIVKHPVIMQHDLVRDSFNTFLMDVFGIMFLIMVKVCLGTRTVYHNVRKIGQISKNHTYTYRLNVANSKANIMRRGEVLSQGPFSTTDDNAICLEINLLANLLKNLCNATFTISIREMLRCYKCKEIKNAKHYSYFDDDNDIFYCKRCYKEFSCCKYSKNGCTLKGKTEVMNHETFFCRYNTWCVDCHENIFEMYMLQHLQNANHTWCGIEHLYSKFYLLKLNKIQYNITVSYKGEAFLFIYTKEKSNNSNKFLVQGKHDLIKMACTLILRNPKTKYIGYYIMLRVYNFSQFFWDIYLSQNELNLFIDRDENTFEMGVEIEIY